MVCGTGRSRGLKKLKVAIDGPAGAGKSTVARIVAGRLDYNYIDSGAMYRAIAWWVQANGVDAAEEEKVTAMAQQAGIVLRCPRTAPCTVLLNGQDISAAIRTPAVSRAVSHVAQIPGVRRAMVALQRKMAAAGGVVMDGRDIGTFVLPDADVNLFLTASVEERARRRGRELAAKGYAVDLAALRQEIACRDHLDCSRAMAPLVQAPDAVLVDSTALDIAAVVEKIIRICRERMYAV